MQAIKSFTREEANEDAWKALIEENYPHTVFNILDRHWFLAYCKHSDGHLYSVLDEYGETVSARNIARPGQENLRLALHILRQVSKRSNSFMKDLRLTDRPTSMVVTTVNFDPADLLSVQGTPSILKLRGLYNQAVREHVEQLVKVVDSYNNPSICQIAAFIGVTNTNDWIPEDERDGPGRYRVQILTTT